MTKQEEKEIIDYNDKTIENSKDLIGVELKRNPYPNVVIEERFIKKLESQVCKLFCNWVKNGKTSDIDYSNDPSWDHSGRLVLFDELTSNLAFKYKTIGEWAEKEHNGFTSATYISGQGLHHDTYSDDINLLSWSMATEILEDGILKLMTEEELWENRETPIYDNAWCSLQIKLEDLAFQIPIKKVWNAYGKKLWGKIMESTSLLSEKTENE